MLLLDPDCPAVAARAAETGESPQAFAAGIRLALGRLADLAGCPGLRLRTAVYDTLPVWRMLGFDQVLYLSAFTPAAEGHRSGMYKLAAAGDGVLHAGFCRELRVRVVEAGGTRRTLLTYKEPPADAASQSKPEHETAVASAVVTDTILRELGMNRLVAFTKQCVNYLFTARGRDMVATIVTVPEIDGTFIELETMTSQADLATALADVRAVLADLGISDDALTTEQYTDAVLRARALLRGHQPALEVSAEPS